MAVVVFTWDMFKSGITVGHASMYVQGQHGDIYISFWPKVVRSPRSAIYSTGALHLIRGDKDEDGQPDWVSRPLEDLDEAAIIKFWKPYDSAAQLDYGGPASNNVTKPNSGGKPYDFLFSQCSTTVVRALISGASLSKRLQILGWLTLNAGTNIDVAGLRSVSKFLPYLRIPTVTPADVRELVKWVWNDF